MAQGRVPLDDMLRTFNMGIGLIIVTAPGKADHVIEELAARGGRDARVIGEIVAGAGPSVSYTGRFAGGVSAVSAAASAKAARFPARRLGVLVSGRGSNLQALIDAIADGRLDASIAVVISNVAGAGGLDRARQRRHRDGRRRSPRLAVARRLRSRARRRAAIARRRTGVPGRFHAAHRHAADPRPFPAPSSTSIRRCCRRFPGSTPSGRRSRTASR